MCECGCSFLCVLYGGSSACRCLISGCSPDEGSYLDCFLAKAECLYLVCFRLLIETLCTKDKLHILPLCHVYPFIHCRDDEMVYVQEPLWHLKDESSIVEIFETLENTITTS